MQPHDNQAIIDQTPVQLSKIKKREWLFITPDVPVYFTHYDIVQ